jgi:hypothetical protein
MRYGMQALNQFLLPFAFAVWMRVSMMKPAQFKLAIASVLRTAG